MPSNDDANLFSVREAVLGLLRAAGMTTCFGNPGSTELPFLNRWPDDLRYVLALQEGCAVAMADGFARSSGRAAFCNLHSAVSIGHAMGKLVTAYRNQAPLVVTAAQPARSLLPGNPLLGATEAASFPKPYVKWSIEPARPQDVPAAIAHAWGIAMTRPPGPTLVLIPMDDWGVAARPAAWRAAPGDTALDPAALNGAARALTAACCPVIVEGPEVVTAARSAPWRSRPRRGCRNYWMCRPRRRPRCRDWSWAPGSVCPPPRARRLTSSRGFWPRSPPPCATPRSAGGWPNRARSLAAVRRRALPV